MLHKWLTVALLLVLSGCYTITDNPKNPLPPGAPGTASYVPPVPSNYRAEIVDKVRQTTKDPYSIRDASIAPPLVGFVGLLRGGDATVVCVKFNAKNSFGAYTGVQPMAFIFRNGFIDDVIADQPIACVRGAIAYGPFPELEQIGAPPAQE